LFCRRTASRRPHIIRFSLITLRPIFELGCPICRTTSCDPARCNRPTAFAVQPLLADANRVHYTRSEDHVPDRALASAAYTSLSRGLTHDPAVCMRALRSDAFALAHYSCRTPLSVGTKVARKAVSVVRRPDLSAYRPKPIDFLGKGRLLPLQTYGASPTTMKVTDKQRIATPAAELAWMVHRTLLAMYLSYPRNDLRYPRNHLGFPRDHASGRDVRWRSEAGRLPTLSP